MMTFFIIHGVKIKYRGNHAQGGSRAIEESQTRAIKGYSKSVMQFKFENSKKGQHKLNFQIPQLQKDNNAPPLLHCKSLAMNMHVLRKIVKIRQKLYRLGLAVLALCIACAQSFCNFEI